MRMGLRHDQVSFLLGFLQLTVIFLLISMRDFSDNLVLPIISMFAIFLGLRLDHVTVKYIKKKVDLSPRLLENRVLETRKKKKIHLYKSNFKDNPINMN
jgi:UDP-GlcNAc:undecaprenyl-phosphate/decaprenyl-phosphate GlcNAc-1-phosphate transferase